MHGTLDILLYRVVHRNCHIYSIYSSTFSVIISVDDPVLSLIYKMISLFLIRNWLKYHIMAVFSKSAILGVAIHNSVKLL